MSQSTMEKPDDVPLTEVERELKELQFKSENSSLFRILSSIDSKLSRFDQRMDEFESKVSNIDSRIERLEHETASGLKELIETNEETRIAFFSMEEKVLGNLGRNEEPTVDVKRENEIHERLGSTKSSGWIVFHPTRRISRLRGPDVFIELGIEGKVFGGFIVKLVRFVALQTFLNRLTRSFDSTTIWRRGRV
jgi:hypothetical protein